MSTDCNHNKLQNPTYSTKPLLLDPWQDDDFSLTNSRPRSYSVGCHPASKEIKGLFSKRGLPSSLEITLGALNAYPKRKSSNGYLKQSLLALFIICMIFVILLYGYYNVRINNFLLSFPDANEPEKMVSVEQVDIPASSDQPVEDIKILEEIDEAIPQHQRLPREIPRDTHQDQESLFPRVYVSVTQENSQHPGLPNSLMQYSYRHQSSQYGQHSFVQRHHYPQHTGVYYAQPHLHVNRMHADYRVRAHHNELAMARQSWLIEHMRHQQPGRASSYIWEAPVNKHSKHLEQVSSNKETEIENDRVDGTVVINEENNVSSAEKQTTK